MKTEITWYSPQDRLPEDGSLVIIKLKDWKEIETCKVNLNRPDMFVSEHNSHDSYTDYSVLWWALIPTFD